MINGELIVTLLELLTQPQSSQFLLSFLRDCLYIQFLLCSQRAWQVRKQMLFNNHQDQGLTDLLV